MVKDIKKKGTVRVRGRNVSITNSRFPKFNKKGPQYWISMPLQGKLIAFGSSG
jgi:hypothetical protein